MVGGWWLIVEDGGDAAGRGWGAVRRGSAQACDGMRRNAALLRGAEYPDFAFIFLQIFEWVWVIAFILIWVNAKNAGECRIGQLAIFWLPGKIEGRVPFSSSPLQFFNRFRALTALASP
jgi:hypothetical protein